MLINSCSDISLTSLPKLYLTSSNSYFNSSDITSLG